MPRRSRTKYLFSYGSNNPEQLSERLEYSVRGAQGAYADGWQRVFRGYSRNWGGGVASLLRKSGSTTYGYVAPVTAEDLDILDRYEGVRSGNYKRQQITVTTADGEEIRAVAYISRSREFNEPTKAYLRATAKTIGQFWSGSGGPVKVSDIPIRNPKRTGKYAAIWSKYGQEGFGIPTMAPRVGSYPLYPISRAKYALVLISSPVYDKKKGERAQIAERALAAHPSLESFWKNRRGVINTRMGVVEPDWTTFKLTKVFGKPVNSRTNPSGQKQIKVRAGSRAELTELIPVAVDALVEMGADDVQMSSMKKDGSSFTVVFTIEGLGSGRRFSRQQRQAFRRLVTAFLPSQIREPSFQNAVGEGFESPGGDPLPGYRDRGSTPDSKRTTRSKARSKARRKTTRRPNPKLRR